jgi:hypothetical protein
VVLLIILAALGSADWIQWLRAKRGWQRSALPVVAAAWALISGALAVTGTMPAMWTYGVGGAQLAAELRDDPAFCGLALYKTPHHPLPGRDRLAGRLPLYAFSPADPAASSKPAAVAKSAPAFNRILSPRNSATDLPAGFSQRDCARIEGDEVCIFARSGDCDAAAATSFILKDVLARTDR